MNILDIEKEKLVGLSQELSEELIFQLAKAELEKTGQNASNVDWSGHINAPDGGVDVRVKCGANDFLPGFIPSSETIFQVKTTKMPTSRIFNEMCPNGTLRTAIADLCKGSDAAYIIVNFVDMSIQESDVKIQKMQKIIDDRIRESSLKLSFYSLSKIHQWLLDNPYVQFWLRDQLKIPLFGWKPYGNWSNARADIANRYILSNSVSIKFKNHPYFIPLVEALPIVRDLLQKTQKSIRIIGLSGIGKTRFVQALFDENVDSKTALNRNQVIYVNIEENPEPRPEHMLEDARLLKQSGYVVVDNCISSLHTTLVRKLNGLDSNLKLITIDYNVSDDSPENTEVIFMQTNGIEIATIVVLLNYPQVNGKIASEIASYSDGNARFALKLSENFNGDGNLTHIDTDELFNRIFYQRGEESDELLSHAEVLSLTYDFIRKVDGVNFELRELGNLIDVSEKTLYRSVEILRNRGLAIEREGHMEILPQALANRLAKNALKKIPNSIICKMLKNEKSRRLLLSFSLRLSIMSNTIEAQNFVKEQIQENGIFNNLNFDTSYELFLFKCISSFEKSYCINTIRDFINNNKISSVNVKITDTFVNILERYAGDKRYFSECIELIILISTSYDKFDYHYSSKIYKYFKMQKFYDLVEIESRNKIIVKMLSSSNEFKQNFGINLLSTAFNYSSLNKGAIEVKPKVNSGDESYKDILKYQDWFSELIEIIEEFGNDSGLIGDQVRDIFFGEIGVLWQIQSLREKIETIALSFKPCESWAMHLQTFRKSILYLSSMIELTGNDYEFDRLVRIQESFVPNNKIDIIKFCLTSLNPLAVLDDFFEKKYSEGNLASKSSCKYMEQLGREFIISGISLKEIKSELFLEYCGNADLKICFGRGLCLGSNDPKFTWKQLVTIFERCKSEFKIELDIYVLSGFIDKLGQQNPNMRHKILNAVCKHKDLSAEIVQLQSNCPFGMIDFDRCLTVLKTSSDVSTNFASLYMNMTKKIIPKERFYRLTRMLLEKDFGQNIVLQSLAEIVDSSNEYIIDSVLRQLAINALEMWVGKNTYIHCSDYRDMKVPALIEYCFKFDDNNSEKIKLVNEIVRSIDSGKDFYTERSFAIQIIVRDFTKEFLDRVFKGNKQTVIRRVSKLSKNNINFLELVKIEPLLEWCSQKNDEEVWEILSDSFECVEYNDEYLFKQEQPYTLTELALKFLEACPNPTTVIRSYFDKIQSEFNIYLNFQQISSGITVFSGQVSAFKSLVEHNNSDISEAVKEILCEADTFIEKYQI